MCTAVTMISAVSCQLSLTFGDYSLLSVKFYKGICYIGNPNFWWGMFMEKY